MPFSKEEVLVILKCINMDKSSGPVTCGMLQGSMLGSLLFIIHINDFDSNVVNIISTFPDDTRISGIVTPRH